jgi:hypothetical protein
VNLKRIVKSIPVLGGVAKRLHAALPKKARPINSGEYWEERYRQGRNSGPGSYNRLAEFKAEFLNGFVETHGVGSVIEFGSGDGAQLKLAKYPAYVGVDVSRLAVEQCKDEFKDRPAFAFMHTSEVTNSTKADLSLSLDVVYHLVEYKVFTKYMMGLFRASSKYVIIYSSNKTTEKSAPHVRHRKFTDWVDANISDFALVEHHPNRYPYDDSDPEHTSFADFYVYAKNS